MDRWLYVPRHGVCLGAHGRHQTLDASLAIADDGGLYPMLTDALNLYGMQETGHLSRAALDEFKRIYEEEFRKVLSDDEAEEMGQRLLHIFRILMMPAQ